MYEKNLKEDLRLRLSTSDMDFLRQLSEERGVSISECLRSMISEYRRSLEAMEILKSAVNLSNLKIKELSNGDTKTDFNDKL